MSVIDGATIDFETNNPNIYSFIGEDNVNKISIGEVCEYLGVNDMNFTDSNIISKVEKVIGMLGEDYMTKIESLVSELGFKSGIVDDIYNRLMIDKEINRVSGNLNNLLQKKYGNTNNI